MRRSFLLLALGAVAASAQPYDHVIITARSHMPAYISLSGWVESVLGMSDTVMAVEDIIPAYPGRDTPEKVRSFIRHAYSNWGTTHVLLGGDVDVIPCRLAYVYRYGRTQNIPCDLYYADLDGDWDRDGDGVFGELEDSVDLYPDIAIGRVPASSPDLAARFVAKVLSYASDSTAPYLDQVLLSGFDLHDEPVIRGEYHCEIVDTTYVPPGMKPCLKVYDSHSGDHKVAILQALNAGKHVWVHADHSSWWTVGAGWLRHGATINANELTGLANGTRYTIGLINGCHVGAFDSSDCAAEAFVSAPNGGGVAAFANARPGLTIDPDWHRAGSFLQAQYLIDQIVNQGGSTSLEALVRLQAYIAPLADTSPTYRWCQYQYNLFGEPVMPVWVPMAVGAEEKSEVRIRKAEPKTPTVVRGVLNLTSAFCNLHSDFALLDASGRSVMDLAPGPNDVSLLAPGVYFLRMDSRGQGLEGSSVKVVIQR